MLHRIFRLTGLALAVALGTPSLASAGITQSQAFSAASSFIPLVPDVCIYNYCISFTNSTALSTIGNMLDANQIGAIAATNLDSISSSIDAGQDMAQLQGVMQGLNGAFPSQQGTALATILAQARSNQFNMQAAQENIAQADGTLSAAQAAADANVQVGEMVNQQTMLQASAMQQQQADGANADNEGAQVFDINEDSTVGWLY